MISTFRFLKRAIFYALTLFALYIWVERSRDPVETGSPPIDTTQPSARDGVAVPVPRPNDLAANLKVDSVFVDKSERLMELRADDQLVARFDIALGFAPDGQKLREGDGKTPTGEYTIDWRNDASQFYRSLHINYPRRDQVAQAAAEGRNPGGLIMIHGQPNGSPYQGYDAINQDWTNGCIAVSNAEMNRIWELVKDGTKIEIIE